MNQHGVGIVHTQYFTSNEPLRLSSGDILPEVTLAYETYGTLNDARDNAILLLHALSGDAHAAGYHSVHDRKPGWWDTMVGPGRAFDTDKYFVICSNVLGGCKGSSGPLTLNPLTGRRYAADFPVVTIRDMVMAQVRLIDMLGIAELHAVAGGSMGGFQAIEWMAQHPSRLNRAILLATSASHQAQAVAWNVIGRQAIMRDPLAPEFEIDAYLAHQAHRFNERFDANSYLYITKAMDYWDITQGFPSLQAALSRWHKPTCILSFDSDWLYPTSESLKIADAVRANGGNVEIAELHSTAGHDAFLLEYLAQTPIIQRFLHAEVIAKSAALRV